MSAAGLPEGVGQATNTSSVMLPRGGRRYQPGVAPRAKERGPGPAVGASLPSPLRRGSGLRGRLLLVLVPGRVAARLRRLETLVHLEELSHPSIIPGVLRHFRECW